MVFPWLPVVVLLHATVAWAGETITVGVATNFSEPLARLAALYEAENSVRVEPISAGTGKLYALVKNGAPIDLLLAADAKTPEQLHDEGVCLPPFVYARGSLVLWSRQPRSAHSWQEVMAGSEVRKIAIAKPELAPYGQAALAVLRESGLWQGARGKIVYSQNVVQAFQYAASGAVDLAFVAASLALSKEGRQGWAWPVFEAPVVVQAGCVVNGGRHRQAATAFGEFLRSAEARRILGAHGYSF